MYSWRLLLVTEASHKKYKNIVCWVYLCEFQLLYFRISLRSVFPGSWTFCIYWEGSTMRNKTSSIQARFISATLCPLSEELKVLVIDFTLPSLPSFAGASVSMAAYKLCFHISQVYLGFTGNLPRCSRFDDARVKCLFSLL